MMCGWSILIEAAKRRQELAFFVAPKAAATVLPRHYRRMVCSQSQSVGKSSSAYANEH